MKYILALLTIISVILSTAKAQPLNEQNKLYVGDDAPPLKIEKWLKNGSSIELFEKGKVYVIDLWATWCVPCLASMPHLSKLQEEYKTKGLEIIGITSEDPYGNTLQNIQNLLQKKDSLIGYAMALVPVSKNKDSLQGIFVHPWMQAAGTMNMPTAFIVDRNGKLAYIGDPYAMEKTLEDVINGHYDLTQLRNDYLERLEAEKVLDSFNTALNNNDQQQAIITANKIANDFKNVKPNTYLVLAANIVGIKGKIDDRLLDIALIATQKGIILTQFQSPGFFDLLASIYAAKGDFFNAANAEKIAISMSEGEMKENQQKNLNNYLKALNVNVSGQ